VSARAGARPIVFTGDESTGSLAAVRALRAAGYAPWLAVSQRATYASRSRTLAGLLEIEASDPAGYARVLAGETDRIRPLAVLPGTEATLRALTGREDLFGEVPVGTAGREPLARATDKSLIAELCAAAGLATAQAARLTLAELDAGAEGLSFPAIVKPHRSIEWPERGEFARTGVRKVETVAELRRVLAEAPAERWVVERFVRGTLAAVCGVAWRGDVICTSHQVSPRTFPPELGISSYAVTVEPDAGRDAGVRRLMRSIGWSGIFGVQFLLAGGAAYVIDVNPRVYGSLALAVAAGHNLPAIWTELLLGHRPRPGPYRRGVRYRVEEDDYRLLLQMLRRGARRDALLGLLPRPNTTHAIFALGDPWPALASLDKLAGKIRRAQA
jgi:predicted ATP-grasp superfamily ATP-dependent carboligase